MGLALFAMVKAAQYCFELASAQLAGIASQLLLGLLSSKMSLQVFVGSQYTGTAINPARKAMHHALSCQSLACQCPHAQSATASCRCLGTCLSFPLQLEHSLALSDWRCAVVRPLSLLPMLGQEGSCHQVRLVHLQHSRQLPFVPTVCSCTRHLHPAHTACPCATSSLLMLQSSWQGWSLASQQDPCMVQVRRSLPNACRCGGTNLPLQASRVVAMVSTAMLLAVPAKSSTEAWCVSA